MQKTAYRARLTALLILSIGHLHSQSLPRDRTDQQNEANKGEHKAASKPETAKSPPTVVSGTQPQSTNKQTEATEKSKSVWEKAFAPEYASNWALAGLACIGAFFAYHTWRALKKQVAANESAAKTAQQTLFHTQRADVLIDNIALTEPDNVANSTVTLFIKNFGRTRANHVRYHFNYGIPSDGVSDEQRGDAPTILGAGADTRLVTRYTLVERLGIPVFRQVIAGDLVFKVWGEASYEDVFGEKHRLTFRARFRPPFLFDIEENEAD